GRYRGRPPMWRLRHSRRSHARHRKAGGVGNPAGPDDHHGRTGRPGSTDADADTHARANGRIADHPRRANNDGTGAAHLVVSPQDVHVAAEDVHVAAEDVYVAAEDDLEVAKDHDDDVLIPSPELRSPLSD